MGTQMQLIKEMVPAATRLGVLINPSNPANRRFDVRETVASLAGKLGVTAQVIEAGTSSNIV
jgi:putative tryptophan/tyrosine transport system substrate-binding protein